MAGWEIALRVLAGLALVAVNGFFVVTEFALTRLASMDRDEAGPGLERAWQMIDELELYLTGCQLGISASSVVLGVVAEPALSWLLDPVLAWIPIGEAGRATVAVVVGVIAIQLVHKIWGEQAPTYLGIERPVQVARRTAPLLYWFARLTYPIILAGDGVAKWTLRLFGVEVTRSWSDEVGDDDAEHDGTPRARVQRALAGTSLPPDRRREIVAAAALDEIPAVQIATPAEEVRCLDVDEGVRGLSALLRDGAINRVPLVDGGLERCVGVLYVPAVLARLDELREGDVALRELAVEPLRLRCDIDAAEAVDRLQEARQELALLEQDGEVCALLTTTDCFEAIVGDLRDPYDAPGC